VKSRKLEGGGLGSRRRGKNKEKQVKEQKIARAGKYQRSKAYRKNCAREEKYKKTS